MASVVWAATSCHPVSSFKSPSADPPPGQSLGYSHPASIFNSPPWTMTCLHSCSSLCLSLCLCNLLSPLLFPRRLPPVLQTLARSSLGLGSLPRLPVLAKFLCFGSHQTVILFFTVFLSIYAHGSISITVD